VVVGNGHAFIVHQHTLQPSVGADGGTDNFAQISEYTVKYEGKQHNRSQSAEVLADGVGHDFPEGFDPDDIGEEKVGYGKGNRQEDRMLQALFQVLGGGIRSVVQLFLLGPVALNQEFYPAEYQLHEDGLRTCPSAPYAAVDGGKEHDTHHGDQHPEHEDV